MKKIICVILVLMLLCTAVACGSPNNTNNGEAPNSNSTNNSISNNDNETAKKEQEYAAAKSAYESLEKAQENCDKMMNAIYGAWYFYIYKSDEYTYRNYNNALRSFCSYTGLTTSEVEGYFADAGETDDLWKFVILADSSAIRVVTSIYANNGTYSETRNLINSAKESLKSVTAEYNDYTGYETLKSYYTEISNYFAFCESPSGSFQQLGPTKENYENNLRGYKNDLSFIFD